MSGNDDGYSGPEAVANIAEHYAAELDAQFRTLNHFAKHSGEIGRAHETFLRGILTRFMPDDLRIGTGFVASPKWVSTQQDILIYKRDGAKLFEVGECIVIDSHDVIGAIEVKTNLNGQHVQGTLEKIINCPGASRMYGIYGWEGIEFDKLWKAVCEFIRRCPEKWFDRVPDVIYVRGKYFMRINRDGDRKSPRYLMWPVGEGGLTEGEALLGIVASIWACGLNRLLPWWLATWHKDLGTIYAKSKPVPWHDDILEAITKDLPQEAP